MIIQMFAGKSKRIKPLKLWFGCTAENPSIGWVLDAEILTHEGRIGVGRIESIPVEKIQSVVDMRGARYTGMHSCRSADQGATISLLFFG